MADRYWVGGNANWDATAGTKWALTSNGAGGQAVPTAADDVFFDASSGANTVTISGSRVAKSITCTGFTGTLAGTSTPALTISGSLTLVAGMTLTYSGTTTFNATGTLTSGGKTLGPVTINGTGITVTLGDALTSSGTLTLTNGTLTTSASNYAITATKFVTTTGTRTLTLNGSLMTLTGSGTSSSSPWYSTQSSNFTLNAGTSTVEFSDGTTSQKDIYVRDKTFSTLKISGAGIATYQFVGNGTGSGTHTVATLQSTKTVAYTLQFQENETMDVGTFSCNGSAGNILTIISGAAGTRATLNKTGGGTVTVDYASIKDNAATPSSTWSATNSTNAGNNTGWTFVSSVNSNFFFFM